MRRLLLGAKVRAEMASDGGEGSSRWLEAAVVVVSGNSADEEVVGWD